VDRRAFLKGSAAAAAALTGASGIAPAVASGSAPRGWGRALVLVELKGGNDGLNTVVPYADPGYARLRPTIGIKRDDVLQLDERTGLHPALAPLMPAWRDGRLAVVQGLGYPSPNLSHFRSIEIWDTASRADEYLIDGWLTRAFASAPLPASFAADGVVIGSNELGPLAGRGTRALVLADTDQFVRQARLARAMRATATPALAHVLRTETDIVQAASGLEAAHVFRTTFPAHPFGNAVKSAARVLASRAGVAVVRITHNGFDTHQGQPGRHALLLKQLAEGLVALDQALEELGRRQSTLVMTYAEFGRRAAENGSGGTDHGTASAHFVMGDRVRGGLHGAAPQLGTLESGNLPFAVDFRSGYATVLERWWGVPSAPVLGGRFETLDFLAA
jgi:uncharacterized protein (DUF1501 family)